MKKYILTIVVFASTVWGTMAQRREFPALQINFKDGTSEVIPYPISSYRYGVENPVNGDYITCRFEQPESGVTDYDSPTVSGNLMPVLSFTQYGIEAFPHCENYGLVFSDSPINMDTLKMDDTYHVYAIVDGATIKYKGENSRPIVGEWDANVGLVWELNANDLRRLFAQELGKEYYLQAYYMLDGEMYYSEQVTQRIPKLLDDVIRRNSLDIYAIDAKTQVVMRNDDAKQQLYAHYGVESSICLDSVLDIKEKEYVASLTENQVKSLASSTDFCDDGVIYYLNLPETVTQEVIAHVDTEASTSFYVKATEEVAIISSSNKKEFTTSLPSNSVLSLIDCDEAWGVKDNQYLRTNTPEKSVYSPALTIKLHRIMLPGKKYNVTFSLAPQTDTLLVDTLDLVCNILIADGEGVDNGNDTYPTHTSLRKDVDTPYFIKNPEAYPTNYDSCYIFKGYADRVTTYTVEYTPERLVCCHAFKVMNRFSAMLSTYRKKYGQNIRLIGVEVTPIE